MSTKRPDSQIRLASVGSVLPTSPEPVTRLPDVPAQARCLIFVSYAHEQAVKKGDGPRDKSTLDKFQSCLRKVLYDLQSRGVEIHEEDVFYDRERLNKEPEWSAAIESALNSCEVLIFLVSQDSADPARFCMQKELPVVVARGRPIVPVLVEKEENWIGRIIPGTQFALGKFHSAGLPKHPSYDTWPIDSWERPAEAWAAVQAGLIESLPSLLKLGVKTTPAPSHPTAVIASNAVERRVKPELLPFLCDHDPHGASFREQAFGWAKHARQALITVVRGDIADGPHRFAERLIVMPLGPIARSTFGWALPEDTRLRLSWPESRAVSEPFPGYELLIRVLEKLDPGYTANDGVRDTVEGLARRLRLRLMSLSGPQVLMINLPRKINDQSFKNGLEALLNGIAHARLDDAEVAKLWIFIIDERPSANVQPTDVTAPDATRLVWLDPLARISWEDVDSWHKEHVVQNGADEWLRYRDCQELFNETANRDWRHRVRRWVGGPVQLSLQDWADAVESWRSRQQGRPG